jgi:cyclophilin family peptidyl-prolyl cis-trans isomerase
MMLLRKLARFAAGATLALAALSSQAAPTVEMQTSMGAIVIELDAEKAPLTVKNFLQYANDGFYNGTIFHRVIEGFMIQGGGFTKDMGEKPTGAQIPNEAKNGLKNQRGTIAMARRAEPHSATAQFFINHKDNDALDYPSRDGWGYAVFGKVTQGLDVVDKIAKVRTGNRGMFQDVPVEPVVIQSVKVTPDKK